jgi:prepilin-type N-terminal cleavage/methylation domain-containing protein
MTNVRPNNLAKTGAAHRVPGAFTLIEVLVVIFILGVLAAIVVSVAGYVMSRASGQETAAIQKTLLEAVQAYYDAGNPNDPNNLKAYPPESTDPNESGKELVKYLTTQASRAKAATEFLLKLPKEAWNGDSNEAIKDGWGKGMQYEAKGGLGGKPLVISSGPDGRFFTDDDIRSDESQ